MNPLEINILSHAYGAFGVAKWKKKERKKNRKKKEAEHIKQQHQCEKQTKTVTRFNKNYYYWK